MAKSTLAKRGRWYQSSGLNLYLVIGAVPNTPPSERSLVRVLKIEAGAVHDLTLPAVKWEKIKRHAIGLSHVPTKDGRGDDVRALVADALDRLSRIVYVHGVPTEV